MWLDRALAFPALVFIDEEALRTYLVNFGALPRYCHPQRMSLVHFEQPVHSCLIPLLV